MSCLVGVGNDHVIGACYVMFSSVSFLSKLCFSLGVCLVFCVVSSVVFGVASLCSLSFLVS